MAPTMGRPSIDPSEYVTVQHLDTGATVSWADGSYTGDPELLEQTRAVAESHAGETIAVGAVLLPIDHQTARGIAAAALSACAGRGIIRSASFDDALTGSAEDDDEDPGTESAVSGGVVY